MKSGSNLEKVLRAGHFAFTGELGPPRGAHAEEVRKKAAKASDDPQRARAVQRAQVDLLVAADVYGVGASESTAASEALAGEGAAGR